MTAVTMSVFPDVVLLRIWTVAARVCWVSGIFLA